MEVFKIYLNYFIKKIAFKLSTRMLPQSLKLVSLGIFLKL